jgi:TolB-like protein/Tfp pilus assembly protein PilF
LGKLIAELRRRNVVRVAGVYAVVGWLVAQAATLLETSLGLPSWFDGVIVAALLLGLPVALILAWAFELTPEGVRLTASLPDAEVAAQKSRKVDYAILVGVALVAGLFIIERVIPPPAIAARSHDDGFGAAADASGADSRTGNGSREIAAPKKGPAPAASIAVLPFADLSADKDQQYFSDGIAEEILNVLARIDGLKVASRTSAFQFRSAAAGIPAIAGELGVRHVLEGSVRKAGNRVRVTAQLIDASTDEHLWSETFDRTLTAEELFAIQDEIAAATVAALRTKLGDAIAESAPAAPVRTTKVEAYELFLKARALFQARRDLGEADGLLARAIEIDPQFADALAIRAGIHQFGGEYGARFDDERAARAAGRAFAEQALAIDQKNSLAIAVQALSHLYDRMSGFGKEDYDRIFASLDRALALDPKDSNALNWLGISNSFVGNHEKAVEIFSRCIAVDPLIAACRSNLAMGYLVLGRLDAANAVVEASLDNGAMSVSPGMLVALVDLKRRDAFLFQAVNSPALRGWRKFDALFDAISRPGEDHRALAVELKAFFDDTGASMRAYSLLNAIGDYERPMLLTYHWIPAMRAYRRSPEFKAHMTASGLPDYWRKHGFPPQCKAVGKDDFACE